MSGEKKSLLAVVLSAASIILAVIVLVLIGTKSPAQAGSSSDVDIVSVNGKAEIKVVPDKASIEVGVELRTSTSEQANEQLKKKTDAIITALKDKGVSENDISTDYYNVSPDYTWDSNNNRIPQGYEGHASLEVSGIDIDDVTAMIDLATASGADYVGNISYYSSTYKESYDEALTEAIGEARAKADLMGQKAGFKIVRVHRINEGYQNDYARYVTNSSKAMDYGYADAESSGISPGMVSIEAEVSVDYVIE